VLLIRLPYIRLDLVPVGPGYSTMDWNIIVLIVAVLNSAEAEDDSNFKSDRFKFDSRKLKVRYKKVR